MSTKILAAALLFACALIVCDASAQSGRKTRHVTGAAPHCQGAFLSADSDWRAQAFDDVQIPWSTGAWPQAKVFTPIEALYVRNGKVYTTTWRTEPVPARAKVVGNEIRIAPAYAAWFPGVDSPMMRQAKQVVPYTQPTVRHVISLTNACKQTPSIDVVITFNDGRTHRVTLARLPTSLAVFEDPAG